MARLAAAGIESLIHYPIPFYKSKAFSEMNHLTFPVTERLAATLVSLPMFATLEPKQITEVVQQVYNEAPRGSL
jgi:dTDP-4-amino-4,6-dideoxygalactose transaminase